MLLIGYTPSYWIIKNQWGEKWGEQGFIRVTSDPQYNCKIGTSAFVMWSNLHIFALYLVIALFLVFWSQYFVLISTLLSLSEMNNMFKINWIVNWLNKAICSIIEGHFCFTIVVRVFVGNFERIQAEQISSTICFLIYYWSSAYINDQPI